MSINDKTGQSITSIHSADVSTIESSPERQIASRMISEIVELAKSESFSNLEQDNPDVSVTLNDFTDGPLTMEELSDKVDGIEEIMESINDAICLEEQKEISQVSQAIPNPKSLGPSPDIPPPSELAPGPEIEKEIFEKITWVEPKDEEKKLETEREDQDLEPRKSMSSSSSRRSVFEQLKDFVSEPITDDISTLRSSSPRKSATQAPAVPSTHFPKLPEPAKPVENTFRGSSAPVKTSAVKTKKELPTREAPAPSASDLFRKSKKDDFKDMKKASALQKVNHRAKKEQEEIKELKTAVEALSKKVVYLTNTLEQERVFSKDLTEQNTNLIRKMQSQGDSVIEQIHEKLEVVRSPSPFRASQMDDKIKSFSSKEIHKLAQELAEQETLIRGYQLENEKQVAKIKELTEAAKHYETVHREREEALLREISIMKSQMLNNRISIEEKELRIKVNELERTLQAKNHDYKQMADFLEEELKSTRKELVLTKQEVKDLKRTLSTHETELKQKDSINSELDSRLILLMTEAQQSGETIRELNARLLEFDKVEKDMKKQLTLAKQNEKSLSETITLLRHDYEHLKSSNTQTHETAKTPELSLVDRVADIPPDFPFNRISVKISSILLHLDSFLHSARHRLNELGLGILTCQGRIDKIISRGQVQGRKQLLNEVEYLKKSNEDVRNDFHKEKAFLINGYEKDFEKLKQDLSRLTNENHLLRTEGSVDKEEFKQLKNVLEAYKAQMESLTKQLEVSEMTRKAIHENTIQILKQSHEDSIKMTAEQHERALKWFTSETKKTSQDLIQVESQRLMNEISDLKLRNEELFIEKQELIQKVNLLEQKQMQLEQRPHVKIESNPSSELAVLVQQLALTKQVNEQYQSEIQYLQQQLQISQMNKVTIPNEDFKRTLEKVKEMYEAKISGLKSLHQRAIQLKSEQLKEFQRELNEIVKGIETASYGEE